MKSRLGNLLFAITALLCFFVLSGHSSIISKAADNKQTKVTGTLLNGSYFCSAIKSLANGDPKMDYDKYDEKIKKIVFLPKAKAKEPKKQKSVSVGEGVAAYYDGKGTISIYSAADKIIFGESTGYMFYGFKELEEIDFGKGRVDTSNVTFMQGMFKYARKLKSLDLKDFDTSHVYSMKQMFEDCYSLEEINLSNMNTKYVGDMEYMFGSCYKLKELDLSSFDTGNVCSTRAMFQHCDSLEKLNISSFNMKNAADISWMFSCCYALESLDLSVFDACDATDIGYMFQACESLKSIDLRNFSSSHVRKAESLFRSCKNLEYLDIRNLDLSAVYNTDEILYNCLNLKTVMAPKATRGFMDFPMLMVIDNNSDGQPDTAETFHKNPISDNVNRMIPFDDDSMVYSPPADAPAVDTPAAETKNAEAIITDKGIAYKLGSDGNAAVIKIEASGKVSINTVSYEGKTYTVKEIESSACKGNKKIKSLSIGNNVTSIGKNAFKGCKKLKKVTINANKSLKIGAGAFKKISREASIKVKGIKGKSKQKLIKAIKKQTNAKVK
ncbi:surface protein [Butyrivibrio sp. ob235]|uniref:BspA family leucine-rich repeat surface protein n=1 Tax=Butyrivibrio sp. ob235 TaxID=1761780 RepID=UPI0008D55A92|nr:BspA family leucine-rich repeat surface protein [Butyrivibrio sp. ob235]SEL36239.1 surface protein [Butyrivibrio sp. ob235]